MNWSWLLVAAAYVLAVAIARRAGVDLPRRVALLFMALVFAFLWRPLTQPVVIVPADVLKLTPPWSELRAPSRLPITKYDVSNVNLHDVPMQIVPWMHQVRESWRALDVPLWNASAGCGYPLMANGQSTPFSPFVLLTLPLPLGYAITAQAALKLLLALVLMYLFCRTRYSTLASTVAAVAYGFSTWMMTWLQFPIATAAAFLPGVLMAIDACLVPVERRPLRPSSSAEAGAVPKARVRSAAVLFSLTVLSGHPETVFNLALIAAAYGLWIGNIRGIVRVLGASLIAACITAPYLVSLAQAITRSQRFAETRATIAPPFSDFPSAILLLQPRFFGHLPIERPWGPVTLESICGFAGVLAIASTVAAAMFIIKRRRLRDVETFYVLGAMACLGIVLGWPGITEAFHAIAGLAPPMRMRLGICFFTAVLIAPVIDWTREEGAAPLLAGAAVVAAMMLVLMRTTAFPTPSHAATALLSLMPSMAVLLAITLFAVSRSAAAVVAGAMTIVELCLTMAYWHPMRPAGELNHRTPLVAALERLRDQERAPFRIVGLGGQIYPNAGAVWNLEDVRVHDPMAWKRYVDFLHASVGWNPTDYYAKWNDASTPLLDRLNVKYVVSDRELMDARYRLAYEGRDGRIYENRTVLPRFHSKDAQVEILRADVDAYRLRVRAPRHAMIQSSVAADPGWTARGVRLFESNGPFLAFMLPPGEHVIDVRYRPRSFHAAAALSLLTLAALATAPALWRRRRARLPR